MNETLLALETTVFAVGATILFRRERIFGLFFIALYIYAIFSQLGYLYFPPLSAQLFAYFGIEVWRIATIFIIGSAISLYVVLRYAADLLGSWCRPFTSRILVLDAPGSRSLKAAIAVIGSSLVLQSIIFATCFNQINWETAQQEDVFSSAPAVGVFILITKLAVAANLALYCCIRERQAAKHTAVIYSCFFASLMLFLVFTFKLGNRTDDVALMLGCAIYEMRRLRLRISHAAPALLLSFAVLMYLNFLEKNRYTDAQASTDLISSVLLKDYYAPAHVLFAAVAFHLVEPTTVLRSNLSNALMFLKQPYLQAGVMENFFPGGATRSASIGFYSLTEGFLFAGFAGFLYNGLVLGALLSLWQALATTSSRRVNGYIGAVLGSMLINLVRGQSSYFCKYLYTYALPGLLIYLCLSRKRLAWTHVELAPS